VAHDTHAPAAFAVSHEGQLHTPGPVVDVHVPPLQIPQELPQLSTPHLLLPQGVVGAQAPVPSTDSHAGQEHTPGPVVALQVPPVQGPQELPQLSVPQLLPPQVVVAVQVVAQKPPLQVAPGWQGTLGLHGVPQLSRPVKLAALPQSYPSVVSSVQLPSDWQAQKPPLQVKLPAQGTLGLHGEPQLSTPVKLLLLPHWYPSTVSNTQAPHVHCGGKLA
jgi:hypothetical protein